VTKVAVLGAGGRMGLAVCAAVLAAEDLELVAAIDPAQAGRRLDAIGALSGTWLEIAASLEAAVKAGAEVVVDFTVAPAARVNLAFCARSGLHAVCGTTGFSESDIEELGGLFSGKAHGVLAANFSIGAALMMRCAELCAPFVEGAEVIELHHARKRDAPSGTSLETIRRMQASRDAAGAVPWAPDPTESEILSGARGATASGGVHVHSVRLPGLVAHQEVLFGFAGEMLSIRHDSFDRASFMPGVLLAVRKVADLPGLTLGLQGLLGL
jgi:4-hydroxy-tetrahydrodipicolinate reductase